MDLDLQSQALIVGSLLEPGFTAEDGCCAARLITQACPHAAHYTAVRLLLAERAAQLASCQFCVAMQARSCIQLYRSYCSILPQHLIEVVW